MKWQDLMAAGLWALKVKKIRPVWCSKAPGSSANCSLPEKKMEPLVPGSLCNVYVGYVRQTKTDSNRWKFLLLQLLMVFTLIAGSSEPEAVIK